MLIGITGAARHGKDSAANALVEKYGFVKLGFADAVREMAVAIDPYVSAGQNRHFTEGDTPFARYSDVLKAVGYETAKSYGDVRRLLQRIGTEAGREVLGHDVWLMALAHKMGALNFPDANIVVNDVRFENEAAFIKQMGGYLIRVTRPNFDNGLPALHPSESAIATLDVDYDIETESFDDLQREALSAFDYFSAFTSEPTVPMPVVALPVVPRVYIAAPWVHKADASAAKQRLLDAGIEVVSGWTERENTPQEVDPLTMQQQAILDRNEVNEANTLIILGLAKSEGKATELGMALGASPAGKRIILVKEDRVGNIFYHLPEVERVDTLDEAITLLGYNSPGIELVTVTRVGDDVVSVETGAVLATKLGTVSSEPDRYQVSIHSLGNFTEDGIRPNRLGVVNAVAGEPEGAASPDPEPFEAGLVDSMPGEHDVVLDAIDNNGDED